MVLLTDASFFVLAAPRDTGDTQVSLSVTVNHPGCLRLPLSSIPPGSGSSSVGEESVQLPLPLPPALKCTSSIILSDDSLWK